VEPFPVGAVVIEDAAGPGPGSGIDLNLIAIEPALGGGRGGLTAQQDAGVEVVFRQQFNF
jgi:hypothetical protein